MITYLDACPRCDPGTVPASPATGYPETIPEGLVTNHQCGSCGVCWSAVRREGWVIARLSAPVRADSAETLESSARKDEAA